MGTAGTVDDPTGPPDSRRAWRTLGLALLVAAFAIAPWTLGELPNEDRIVADMRRLGQLYALQLFALSAGVAFAWCRMRRQSPAGRMLGAGAIVAAFVANPWFVGHLLTPDGQIDDFGRLALLLSLQTLAAFGGLALIAGWIRPGPAHFGSSARTAVLLAVIAAAFGSTFWGLALYNRGHSHAVLVPAELANVTAEQRQWTVDFHERALAAAIENGWFDFDTAMAQGFQADPVNRTHFPHPEYLFDDVILDPERPEWLVYHDSPDGKVLMALMFFTRELDEQGPTPAGPLALWHYHPYWQPRCAIERLWTVGKPDQSGECAEGEVVLKTPEMFHVWFIDHPLSRYTEMKIVPEYWQDVGFDIRWYHPILVHFTIALYVVAVLLDLLGVFTKRPDLHFAAWLNLLLAGLFTVGTIASGMTAEVYSSPTVEAHWTLDTHKLLAAGVAVTLMILVPWRAALRGRFPAKGGMLFMLVGLLGVSLVAGAGYYGGEMVYKHGTAVRAVDDFARKTYWEKVRREYLPASRDAIERIRSH